MPKFEIVFTRNLSIVVDAPNADAAEKFTGSNFSGIVNGAFGNNDDDGWYQIEGSNLPEDADYNVSVNENGDVI